MKTKGLVLSAKLRKIKLKVATVDEKLITLHLQNKKQIVFLMFNSH